MFSHWMPSEPSGAASGPEEELGNQEAKYMSLFCFFLSGLGSVLTEGSGI